MKDRNANGLDRSPIHLLHRAYQSAGEAFQAGVRIGGLTPRQLAVLLAVAENEGLSQTGVVVRTGIDRSTVAEMIRRMQRKGLLQRRRTRADARTYALKLTDEGRRVLRAAEPLAKTVDARVLNALPSAGRDQFIDALQALVAALDGGEPSTAGAGSKRDVQISRTLADRVPRRQPRMVDDRARRQRHRRRPTPEKGRFVRNAPRPRTALASSRATRAGHARLLAEAATAGAVTDPSAGRRLCDSGRSDHNCPSRSAKL